MGKILKLILIFIFIFFSSLIILLVTSGLKTKKFNNFITQKIDQNYKSIELNIETIQFKLDIKELSLFLETQNPTIYYKKVLIPTKNIKVYIDFLPLIISETNIKKIILDFNQINIDELKIISKLIKPSNLKSFINNKLQEGNIKSEIEIYFDKNNMIDSFITRGEVTNLRSKIFEDLALKNASFSFLADQSDILIKNFFGKTHFFTIEKGDLKLEIYEEIDIVTNFKSKINNDAEFKKIKKFLSNFKNLKDLSNIQAELDNSLILKFDKTYKLKNFNYKNNGKIKKADLNFENSDFDQLLKKKIEKLSFKDINIITNITPNKNFVDLSGKYSLNKSNPLNFKASNEINKELLELELSVDYDEDLEINILNYLKKKGDIANIKLKMTKKKNSLKIDQLKFRADKNSVIVKEAKLLDGKLISLNEFSVKTFKDNKKNNDFSISLKNIISIKGEKFDASNLLKVLNQQTKQNIFSTISNDIEIDFKNIVVPVSEELKNFKLIGKIENGKFTKISSKGEFDKNNYLDITMKNDQLSNKKYLEIYSDITKPLLSEYNFFKGLSGGKLFFSSIIEEDLSNSKLKIENFKVVNAPGMIQLLSLADLGGLADLAAGEGISFEILEINMEKKKETLKLNEILALGPSISILMEGYQDPNITSLRGTLVPAKTLNTLISKIPVLGDIVIPKEVGEGLFGISFKMKGPKGNIKTTINPIRTLTPRFIQKIIERKKTSK